MSVKNKFIDDYPLADLIPYINNSRTHSDEQVAQVAASIKEFGFTNPILIDEQGGIIAGHGRTMAAKKLGLDRVPCIVLSGLTEAQKKAYVIADNQLALNSGWDLDALRLEIETLQELDFDIDLLGFDDLNFADVELENEELELKEQDYSEKFNVIIECNDEHQQEVVYKKLQAEGYVCQVQSL
jgi:ParB-like chromosome segregation protein Spo0J